MYVLIRYPIGVIVEALVLCKEKHRMRLVAMGFPDAFELKRSGSQWFTAAGEPVEFEFLLSTADFDDVFSASKAAVVAPASDEPTIHLVRQMTAVG
jgi:hypothetical protein